MMPPYDAPYWHSLKPRERLNDLVHKIAQMTKCSYPDAYATASRIIDAPGPGVYALRLANAGKLGAAMEMIAEHIRREIIAKCHA